MVPRPWPTFTFRYSSSSSHSQHRHPQRHARHRSADGPQIKVDGRVRTALFRPHHLQHVASCTDAPHRRPPAPAIAGLVRDYVVPPSTSPPPALTPSPAISAQVRSSAGRPPSATLRAPLELAAGGRVRRRRSSAQQILEPPRHALQPTAPALPPRPPSRSSEEGAAPRHHRRRFPPLQQQRAAPPQLSLSLCTLLGCTLAASRASSLTRRMGGRPSRERSSSAPNASMSPSSEPEEGELPHHL